MEKNCEMQIYKFFPAKQCGQDFKVMPLTSESSCFLVRIESPFSPM